MTHGLVPGHLAKPSSSRQVFKSSSRKPPDFEPHPADTTTIDYW
ncbi:hypothetical protein FRUB_09181 [Fimbriiglobus ruber]|uniref:Uncharacterized protein n=1 Tax=Fimbriiglobus ruber TaxID=1908690 RepID=A0A225DDL9_9BACT|nr:hypothetical protein FRUB_09181 [Fimbriiglobus ruber]